MANKKPIFTKRVSAGTRVYYMDAHKDGKGQFYLSITEIPTEKNPGKKERQRIFIHQANLGEFTGALEEIITQIKNDAER